MQPLLQGGERDDFRYETNRLTLVKKRASKAVSDRYAALWKQREALKKSAPPAQSQALCVAEDGPAPRDTFVLLRGNPHNKGDKVGPAFPAVLTAIDAAPPKVPAPAKGARTAGRRRVLADWIADARNPLTARVMVNRVFQFHFGRGIVSLHKQLRLHGHSAHASGAAGLVGQRAGRRRLEAEAACTD